MGAAELVDDLLHSSCVPHDCGIREQTQATGLLHDFVQVAIPELTPVGEEEPAGQSVPRFAPSFS